MWICRVVIEIIGLAQCLCRTAVSEGEIDTDPGPLTGTLNPMKPGLIICAAQASSHTSSLFVL